jgi:ABC-type branched-subunit amino acid transport system substrate-binding protein
MRLLRFLSAVILAASVNIGGADAADDVPVRLGAVYGLTGDWSPFDVPSTRGAQLFVKHANARGGVLGRPLALVVRDTEGKIDKAAEAIGSLVAEYPDMPAIFGLSESDPVIAAAKLAATDRRIFVTSGATSPKLPSQVPTWLFLACFGDNVQAAAAAEYAYDKLNARSASVAYDDSHTYTRLLQGYFIDSFKALGGEIRSVVKLAGAEDLANATGDLAPADIVFLAAETPPEAYAGVQTLRGHEAASGLADQDDDALYRLRPGPAGAPVARPEDHRLGQCRRSAALAARAEDRAEDRTALPDPRGGDQVGERCGDGHG